MWKSCLGIMLSRKVTENTNSSKCDLSPLTNGMDYKIGVCATVIILAFLNKNQGFIKKPEQNGAESQRIEIVTSIRVAQQHFLFRMLLSILVYPIPASC